MIERIDALDAQRLIADGVRTLDVLPKAVFRDEHLPGATNMPLATFEPSQVESFDRAEPVIVYCFDQHCDLSARTAARLDLLGFEIVCDLIGGRAAWTALGFPTEGAVGDQRRISAYLADVPSVPVEGTIADVRSLGESRYPVPVTSEQRILVGAVSPAATALPTATRIADVMVPAPGTIRPELRVDKVAEQLRKDGLDHVFVTAVTGVLLGLVVTNELHV